MKFLAFFILLIPSFAFSQKCGIDCMICTELSDTSNYEAGSMKSMKSIVPGEDTWLFRSDVDLSNDFGIPVEYIDEFNRLINTFKDTGTEVVIIQQPTRGLMAQQYIISDYSKGFNPHQASESLKKYRNNLLLSGAIVPDIKPLIDSQPDKYFFRRDHHWTPKGARETALLVADELKRHSVYESLTKKEFRTEPFIIIRKDGTMNRALKHICGNNYGYQYVQGFQTFSPSNDVDDIFGSQELPEVVLVGTSNSALRDDDLKNYNFEGFLKEYLSVDILNYALAGGGQEGALVQYLLSDDYDVDNPPKLLLWELPINYDLADEKIYRQLIPAIKGGCKTTDVLINNKTQHEQSILKDERIEVLSNAGENRKLLNSSDYFIDITFSNKAIKDFYVITYYDNGRRDKVWFRRYDIVDGGRYLLELSDKPEFKDQNFLSVFVQPTEEYSNGTTIEASLCKKH